MAKGPLSSKGKTIAAWKPSDAFRENYDRIFQKRIPAQFVGGPLDGETLDVDRGAGEVSIEVGARSWARYVRSDEDGKFHYEED